MGRKKTESFKTEGRKLNLISSEGAACVFEALIILLTGDEV